MTQRAEKSETLEALFAHRRSIGAVLSGDDEAAELAGFIRSAWPDKQVSLRLAGGKQP